MKLIRKILVGPGVIAVMVLITFAFQYPVQHYCKQKKEGTADTPSWVKLRRTPGTQMNVDSFEFSKMAFIGVHRRF